MFPPPAFLTRFSPHWQNISQGLFRLIVVAPCWMEATCLPTVLKMLVDVPNQCPIVEDLTIDVWVSWVLKGLQVLHLTTLPLISFFHSFLLPFSSHSASSPEAISIVTEMWVAQTRVLFHSLLGSGGGDSSIYEISYPTMLKGVDQMVYLRMFLPLNKKIFWVHLFRIWLAWCTIDIYCSAISAFSEPHYLHKALDCLINSK